MTRSAISHQLTSEQHIEGALRVAESMKDNSSDNAGYRTAALREILPHTKTSQQIDRVLEIARLIQADKRKAAFLVEIAPHLTTSQQLENVSKMTQSFKKDNDKINVLRAIAPHLKTSQEDAVP